MPRKSTDSLTVVPIGGPKRPDPPAKLTAPQATTWRAVVATKPVKWWDAGSIPMLVAYCKAIDVHDAVSLQIEAFEPEWLLTDDGLARFDRLAALQERQARVIASLATRMRLSQQARLDKTVAATSAKQPEAGPRPWDFAPGVRNA